MTTENQTAGQQIISATRPYFGLLVGLGERHDREEDFMEWKSLLVKEALEELKNHEREERTVELTETVLRTVWSDEILPSIASEICVPQLQATQGRLEEEDSIIPGHWEDPSLCYTTEVIEDAGEDWASPTLCLSILDAFEETLFDTAEPQIKIPEEPEPEAEKPEETEEPEPEAEKPEEPEPEDEPSDDLDCRHIGSEETWVEEPEPEAEKPESTMIANPADRSESRLLNWEWFREIAEMDNPSNLPKVVEHLNGKGLIRTKQDMLDTILLVLVVTKKLELGEASVILDRFDALL